MQNITMTQWWNTTMLSTISILMMIGCVESEDEYDLRRMSILNVWDATVIIKEVTEGVLVNNDTLLMELDFRSNGELHTRVFPSGSQSAIRDWYYQLNPERVIVVNRSTFSLRQVLFFEVLVNTLDEQHWYHFQFRTEPPNQDNTYEVIWLLSR